MRTSVAVPSGALAHPTNETLTCTQASTSSPIFEDNAPLTVDKCERVVQEMGFPYIHFLHTYYYT